MEGEDESEIAAHPTDAPKAGVGTDLTSACSVDQAGVSDDADELGASKLPVEVQRLVNALARAERERDNAKVK